VPILDARYFKSILICPDKGMVAELMPMLAYGLPLAPIHDITTYPNRRQLADLAKSFEPKLFFLDFASAVDQAMATLTDINAVLPGVTVIALLAGNNPDLILNCLRQGAGDFLIRPFTTDQIDSAVEKLARQIPGRLAHPMRGGRVIAVMPARGGCGATTMACNLAHQSKRLGVKRTLLCDFDALTGTVSFVLKLKSGYSFADVLHRQGNLDQDLWKQMIVQQPQGLDILLSPENTIEYANDLPSAAPILEFARSQYDVLVLDCGGSFETWNLSIANACDELLLVTTNEPGPAINPESAGVPRK
jgi:pilus assembly protein CpaE